MNIKAVSCIFQVLWLRDDLARFRALFRRPHPLVLIRRQRAFTAQNRRRLIDASYSYADTETPSKQVSHEPRSAETQSLALDDTHPDNAMIAKPTINLLWRSPVTRLLGS